MADDEVDVKFGAQIEGLVKGVEEVKGLIEGVGGAVGALPAAVRELGEAILVAFGVEKIEQWMERIAESSEQLLRMSAVLGISVETASEFSETMEVVGGSAESAMHSLELLQRNVSGALRNSTSQQAETFQQLGISMDEVRSHSGDMNSMIELLRDRWQHYQNDTYTVSLFHALLGRSFDTLIPYFRKTSEEVRALQERMAEAGAGQTQQFAENWERVGEDMKVMDAAFTGIGHTLMDAFRPALQAIVNGLTYFVEGLNNSLKAGGVLNELVLGPLVLSFNLVIVAISLVSASFQDLWTIADGVTRAIISGLVTLGKVVKDAVTLNWDEVAEDWRKGTAAQEEIFKTHIAKITDIGKQFAETYKNLLAAEPKPEGAGGEGGEGAGAKAKITPPRSMEELSRGLQKYLQDHAKGLQDLKRLELDYWNYVLENENILGSTRQQIDAKVFMLTRAVRQEDLQNELATLKTRQSMALGNYNTIMAIENERIARLRAAYGEDSNQYRAALLEKQRLEFDYLKQTQTLAVQWAQTQVNARKADLDDERAYNELLVSYGTITNAQKLALDRAYTEEQYRLDRDQLTFEMSQSTKTVEERAALYNKILELDRKFQTDMRKNNIDTAQDALRQWQGVFSAFGQNFNSALQGILNGTATFTGAMRKLLGDLVIQFIQARIKIELDWLAGEAAKFFGAQAWMEQGVLAHIFGEQQKVAATAAATAERTGIEAAGAAESSSISLGAAIVDIGRSAYKAAAGAYAAIASIPYVGPVLAPAAAAAALAAVIAMIASLDVGAWNVPGDMVAQIHQGEMVVPQTFAQGLRDGSLGGNVGDTHFHGPLVMVQGTNASPDDIATAVGAALRNNHPALRNQRRRG
jgi:hypothetical protein